MRLFIRVFLSFLAIVLLGQVKAMAFPDYLDLYKSDPFRRADVDGCDVCHIAATGGGEHNSLGLAFFEAGERITPILRSNYPEKFDFPQAIVGEMIVHFSDPNDSSVVIEIDDIKYLVDLVSRSVTKGAMRLEPTPSAVVDSSASLKPKNLFPLENMTPDSAFLGSRIVNLPNPKPIERGALEFLVGQRFTMPVFRKDSADAAVSE